MEIPENSNTALVSLLLTFAYVDGELNPKEVEVIKSVCSNLDIEPDLVTKTLSDHDVPEKEYVSLCLLAMSKISDEDLQNKALLALCDVAAADEVLDENEQRVLTLASKHWGVEVVKHDELRWDKHQRVVVEAAGSERMEVHAGPGMGKTAVACARVSRLIEEGVEPSNIWLLSFTRTAVQELRDRIELFTDNSYSVLGVKIGTIDSRAWRNCKTL